MNTHKCPECGKNKLQERQSELICGDCGLVIEDSPVLHDGFISERIKNEAAHPGLAKAGARNVNGRVFKAQWLLSTREKNLQSGITKIEFLASRLKIPDRATIDARLIFKRALENNLAIGRDIVTLAYASVYASCQINGVPKTVMEVVAFSEVSKVKLLRVYNVIKETLKLKIQNTDPTDLLPRFASRLQLKPETQLLSFEILSKLKHTKVVHGRRPETLIASAIYLASKLKEDKRTQREIANSVGVIEVTIRKRCKEIEEQLSLEPFLEYVDEKSVPVV